MIVARTSVATASLPVLAAAATAPPWPPDGSEYGQDALPTVVDCVLLRRSRVPRDRSGRPVSAGGRAILVRTSRRLGLPDQRWVRDDARRWFAAGADLFASVSHGDTLAVAAFTTGAPVGIDLQEHRHRPAALGWLATVIGRNESEPASIREFCECEALIKASRITKEGFGIIPLPPWLPGPRPLPTGHWVISGRLDPHHEFAVVTAEPARLRWSYLDESESDDPRKVVAPCRTSIRSNG